MAKTYLIVDDHEMLRNGIIGWLKDNSDFSCMGEAGTLPDVMEILNGCIKTECFPDVIISDINFSGENTGFELIRQVNQKYPAIKIIVYSMFFSPNVMKESFISGASGYISKNAKTEELLNCMNTVIAGKSYIEKGLVQNYVNYTNIIDSLTKREADVAGLLVQYKSNDEIAEILGLKKRSVENYISLIYEKIGVVDRSSLIAKLS